MVSFELKHIMSFKSVLESKIWVCQKRPRVVYVRDNGVCTQTMVYIVQILCSVCECYDYGDAQARFILVLYSALCCAVREQYHLSDRSRHLSSQWLVDGQRET